MGMTRRPHAPHRARRAGLDPPSQWQTVAGGGVAGQDPPCDQTSCSSKALSTARVRSRTPSLLRMFDTWFLIVPSATPSQLAISLLEKPEALSLRIPVSRSVSGAGR